MRDLRRTRLIGIAAALLLVPVTAAQAAPASTSHTLKPVLPSVLLQHRIGAVPAAQLLKVGLTVRGQDDAGLAQFERALATPGSPSYGKYLTPAEYARRFGASAADASAVRSWVARSGMRISYTNRAGTYLLLSGTARQAQNAFHVTLSRYTSRGQSYVANDRGPTVPRAVVGVAGLDEVSGRLSTHVSAPASFPLPASTSPASLWKTYEQPSTNRGKGQKLAAFGWGSPSGVASDLLQFQESNGLPRMPLKTVQVGDTGTDTAGRIEWNLDSQAASGMAPDASGMTFYFAQAGFSNLLAGAIYTWADDPAGAKQASASYGLCEIVASSDPQEGALKQAVVEGRTVFASTGDAGSGCSLIVGVNGVVYGPVPAQEYPATSPHAVAVGGTVVYTKDASGTREREIAWTHGGGGPSYVFPTPAWQAGMTLATVGRAEADVSAQSGDLLSGYKIVSAGKSTEVGGTSLSAPLWQGIWTRINAAGPLAPDGVANLGFAAPKIYANNANATKYARDFNDISVGVNGLYPTLPGYDYPTGWGTPRVANLMKDLTGRTTPNVR